MKLRVKNVCRGGKKQRKLKMQKQSEGNIYIRIQNIRNLLNQQKK